MHTSTFTYIPKKVGEPMWVKIDQDDELHHVSIGGIYLGTMEEDEKSLYGWKTEDELLLEELPDLAIALSQEKAVNNLPYALKERFPNDLVGWDWNDDDLSLKLIAHSETELHEFAGALRDQIHDVVLFERDLIVYLVQEGSKDVEEIHVNC